eukprot:5907777-Alexandrium_andersonii.AAC.1
MTSLRVCFTALEPGPGTRGGLLVSEARTLRGQNAGNIPSTHGVVLRSCGDRPPASSRSRARLHNSISLARMPRAAVRRGIVVLR